MASQLQLQNMAKALAVHAANAAWRREEYAWLREQQDYSIADAAARLKVCLRTAERYERWRKARAS